MSDQELSFSMPVFSVLHGLLHGVSLTRHPSSGVVTQGTPMYRYSERCEGHLLDVSPRIVVGAPAAGEDSISPIEPSPRIRFAKRTRHIVALVLAGFAP